jgi:hypothetical protein
MKTFFTKTLVLASAVILMSSCASSYKTISPENMHYEVKSESNNVILYYRHGVLGERRNKKYVKKESRNFIKVVAVKLTNNTGTMIDVNRDVKLFSGPNQFSPLEPTLAHSRLKQGVPIYLLYMLFTPMKLVQTSIVNGQPTETSSTPIGFILGPGLTLYNIVKAGSANQKMLQNLQKYSLLNKQVGPGESIYGLVVIPNSSYHPLTIKVGEEELTSN